MVAECMDKYLGLYVYTFITVSVLLFFKSRMLGRLQRVVVFVCLFVLGGLLPSIQVQTCFQITVTVISEPNMLGRIQRMLCRSCCRVNAYRGAILFGNN